MVSEAAKAVNGRNVRVMFQDEGRFGRIGLPRPCWAPSGIRPKCPSQIIREYIYAYSAISPRDGEIDSLIAPYADSKVMELFLAQVADRFKDEFIIMFMDKAAWHTTAKLRTPENMAVLFLPPYSPQLNPVEHLWKEVRSAFFANRLFDSIRAVEDQLFDALAYMNANPELVQSFAGFSWIVTNL